MSAGHSPDARATVFKRDDWTCQGCGFQQTEEERQRVVARGGGGRYLTLDHIVPRSKGGRNAIENLQVLCNVCNIEKGDAVDPADVTPRRVSKRRAAKIVAGPHRSRKGNRMLLHDPRCDATFCINTCPVYLDRGVFV